MSRTRSQTPKSLPAAPVRAAARASGLRARVSDILSDSSIRDLGLAWKFPGEAVGFGGRKRVADAGRVRAVLAGETGVRIPGGASSSIALNLHARRDEWKMVLLFPRPLRGGGGPALGRLRALLRAAARAHWKSLEQERTRRAWGRALNVLEEGMLLVRGDGIILEAGTSACSMLGISAHGLRGRSLAEALGLDAPLRWASGRPVHPMEVAARHASGGALALLLSSHSLGRTGSRVVVLADRTAERRAGEQARRRDRLAVLGELSAGVAHEIRNPLAGINTSAQVLRRRLGPEDERIRFVDVIQDEVARLDRIVSGLLDYARPWNSSLQRVSIPECAGKVLGLVRETAAAQGVVVDVRCAPGLPEVFADPDQLTQVLLNIFRNGLEAMPQGGRLTLDGALIERVPFTRRTGGRRAGDPVLPQEGRVQPQPVVQLRIADTGGGIHPDHLPRLFDPFFTTKPTGTGLGLAICQTLVHEHGGSIAAVSTPGQGTVITIELPVEKRHGERRGDGNGIAPAHRG